MHKGDVHVDIGMIKGFDHLVLNEPFEDFQVQNKACIRIDFAGNGDPKLKIMAVPVLVGTFTEDLFVAGFIPVGVPKFVGGIEMRLTGYQNHKRCKDTKA